MSKKNIITMKHLPRLLLLIVATMAMTNCGQRSDTPNDGVKQNSSYYWKTTFDISPAEMDFLESHDIKRLYVRMFDVAREQDLLSGTTEIVPIATTKFVSAIPAGIEIVPVTYITIEALRAMNGKEEEFATLIVERLLAMASYNNCGTTKEIQLDCDWTSSTKESYYKLCRAVRKELASSGIELSITIRLHQMQETPPRVDRGVLMLYNTGALKDPSTSNSILHIADVKPYLRPSKYKIPLDYAYPAFGWGVKFDNNKFVAIVSHDEHTVKNNEYIRHERPTAAEITTVKELVEKAFGKPSRGNILYHLDETQLKNYTDDEINQILNY